MRPAFRYLLLFIILASSVANDRLCAADDDGFWITFVSHRTGENLLYRMRPDGSECQPIFGGPIADAPGVGEGMSLYREPH